VTIALATCAEVPGLDDEGRLLLSSLAAAGIDAEPAVWDDPGAGWDTYELVLLRSTWDYHLRPQAFLQWAESIGTRLRNPPAMVAWNASKRYLADLASWGPATVPTTFVAPGDLPELPAEGEFVVKPSTSAGSKDTARYRAGDPAAAAHVEALGAAGREVMVQPYLSSVDETAETALVFLGGEFSHAMRKGPLLELGQGLEQDLFRPEEMSPREPSARQLELGRAVVGELSERIGVPLYARVDLLDSDAGEPLVLELELIEPSLFLDFHPPAAERLVALLAAELGR
jgi:glutathione synthase/RimK-type ligase-like ATP-grasp enzyme